MMTTDVSPPLVKRRVLVFFHICTVNHYREIVAHISQRLHDSGLGRVVTTLYYCLSGPDAENEPDPVRDLLPNGWNAVLLQRQRHRADFERLTLHIMAKEAARAGNDDAFYTLYVHSKGVTKTHHLHQTKAWRNLMLTFVADYWPLCLSALETDPLRAVSCNLHHWPSRHFSGNYWWTSSEYLQTLPTPIGPAYLDPEMWIGRGRGTCVSLYQHPNWCYIGTNFDHPTYHNGARAVDAAPEVAWDDVDECMWWGRGATWALVRKTDLPDKDATHRTVSSLNDVVGYDPCPNLSKMLLLRVRGRLLALVEGDVLRIRFEQDK